MPLSVDCSGVTQAVASVVYEKPAGRLMIPAGSGCGGPVWAVAVAVKAIAAKPPGTATARAAKRRFMSLNGAQPPAKTTGDDAEVSNCTGRPCPFARTFQTPPARQ